MTMAMVPVRWWMATGLPGSLDAACVPIDRYLSFDGPDPSVWTHGGRYKGLGTALGFTLLDTVQWLRERSCEAFPEAVER